MPLVIVTGFPSSGKSRRSIELKEYLEKEKEKKVVVVCENDELGKEKNVILGDSRLEKDLRGFLRADVLRHLGRETVVIFDAGNYIKGFRYELYCASKQIKTPHCVVHALSPIDQAWTWNQGRPEQEQYTKEVFDGLVMRYEAPNSSNRWDSPLFTLLPEDPLPFDPIYEALFVRKPPPPNQSTETQPLSSTNFLYELDRTTKEVTTVIMNSLKFLLAEEDIKIPGSTESISIGRKVTLSELTRARRQFIAYTKLHPVEDTGKLTSLFVQYLNRTLG